mgnify:CR=1 FL=1|tara:strand:- start:137 stop:448 length:312 start_codon:yes stop_codon:yes gene_type:complete
MGMKSSSKEYKDTLQHAKDVLDYNNLEYELKNHTLYIQHPYLKHIAYDYRFTTGKWAKLINKRNRLRKHYESKDIEDFVYNYILDGNTEDEKGLENNEQYASN